MSARALSVLVLLGCTPIEPPEKPAVPTEVGTPEATKPVAPAANEGLPWVWTAHDVDDLMPPWPADRIVTDAAPGQVTVTNDDDAGVHVEFRGPAAKWKVKLGTHDNTAAIAVAPDAVFAVYHHRMSTGARATKLRLSDGSAAWDVALVGAGPISHSKYRNATQVQLLGEQLHVYGWESSGVYVEVLDPQTGEQINHTDVPDEFAALRWTWTGNPDNWERAPVVFEVGDGAKAKLVDGKQARLELSGTSVGSIALPHAEGELGTGAGVMHEGTIYFAHCSGIATGAWLYAIRPSDGAVLWEKRLLGLPDVAHSEYWNMLQIDVHEGAIVVFGNEAAGRYLEVVDRSSGATIVNKSWKPK